MIVTCFILPNN